jgi:hypothetical protein
MMNSRQNFKGPLVGILLATMFLSIGGPAIAFDDGARAYWKARDGAHVVSTQYIFLDMQATDTQMFDPSHFIFPNSDVEANLFLASYAYHFTLFGRRPSSLAVNLAGGSADINVSTTTVPSQFLPPGVARGASFSQSASGWADPTVQLDVNLFGTPPLISTVDLLNYEPTWTVDAAIMLGLPVGNYDDDRLINMGQNRFFSRLALPMKYHIGPFAAGYMTSLELTPSVWILGANDDFMGQELENDPLWQVEAHVTHDFTRTFYGSLDLLYRRGFQSDINGVSVGEELDVGNVGLTLNYQITDNFVVRSGFSSNVFGDDGLDNSLLRIQFVYGWHRLMENLKKLKGQSH